MDEDSAALGCLTILISIALLTFSIWEFVKICDIEKQVDALTCKNLDHLGE